MTRQLTIGSLFTGALGLDMAVEKAFGARLAWVCENDPAACRVIVARVPGIPNLGDITGVDWATVPPVDILAGGFPCQDVSTAGLRKGVAEGTRSGLWLHFAKAVAAIRPQLVVIENVRGLLSARAIRDMGQCEVCVGLDDDRKNPPLRALGAVLGDLADIGYDACWRVIPASAVGAPHRRERVFILAWPAAHSVEK